MQRPMRGFTLIELMIAVAIIGILAAIAYPSYTSYVLRGKRSLAKAVLTEVASRQENFFVDRKTYADELAKLGYGTYETEFCVVADNVPRDCSGATYRITLGNLVTAGTTVLGYTITATGIGSQARDKDCTSLTVNNKGEKTAAGANSANCWKS